MFFFSVPTVLNKFPSGSPSSHCVSWDVQQPLSLYPILFGRGSSSMYLYSDHNTISRKHEAKRERSKKPTFVDFQGL
jgi:hypothetical protein